MEEFKRGELVEVSDDQRKWYKNRIYITTINELINNQYKYLVIDKEGSNSGRYKYIRKIKTFRTNGLKGEFKEIFEDDYDGKVYWFEENSNSIYNYNFKEVDDLKEHPGFSPCFKSRKRLLKYLISLEECLSDDVF